MDYDPSGENDDWACDWEESFETPNVPVFPDLPVDASLTAPDEHVVFLYAIATPTGVFAEVAERLPTAPPLCIGFHDQAPITRA